MKPDVLTRVCLVSAAALPWYAVASGLVGLYFYVLLLSEWGGDFLGKSFRGGAYEDAIADALVTSTLLASFPLGGLLLFVMPFGLLWAVVKYPPGGLAGAVVRVGCLVAMALASLYASLLLFGLVTDLSQGGTGGLWWTGWVHVAVLLAGLAATWRSLWWMNRRDAGAPYECYNGGSRNRSTHLYSERTAMTSRTTTLTNETRSDKSLRGKR